MAKILISGATGYLGSRIAKHFTKEGNSLLLSGRNKYELLSLREELNVLESSIKVEIELLDLADRSKWDASAKRFIEFSPAVYFNCAAIQGSIDSIANLDISDYENVMNVNLYSSIYFTTQLTTSLGAESTLRIIHFSGGGATSPRPLFAPYSLSKTALVRFIENFAAESFHRKTFINAIAPGVLPSKMQTEIASQPKLAGTKEFQTATESLKLSDPSHPRLLKLCEFLASDKSDGISGKLISAEWDAWENWPSHMEEIKDSELYTLRRVTARDEGLSWGDRQ